MDRKNIAEGTDGEEDNRSEEPRPRRDGSPAMSVASAVLEWDPSADVGAMGSASSDGKTQNARNQLSQRNVLEGFSQCDMVYGPKVYDLEGGKSPNRSRPGFSSRRGNGQQQNVKGCTYSTPSSSPVPLGDLQFSPVVPQSSYNHQQNSNNVQLETRSSQNIGIDSVSRGKLATTTSDEDNNDDLTEGRRTPGRAVSESSTDWEYDQEKNVPTTSLSQWQTSGLTKSEIEYQTRKKNGSSTSIASSVLMLKVETKINSPGRGSPENKQNNGEKPVSSSSQERSEESELNRKIRKILNERQAKRKTPTHNTGTTSVSDPSTMCGLVKDYVGLLEGDSSKENIQYDVLKKHRDYHLMKVWKQISTLETLNMQLLRLESARARQSKQSGTRYANHRGEGDASSRIVEPKEMLKQKKKKDADRKKLSDQEGVRSAKHYSTSLSVRASSTENYSDDDGSERKVEHRTKSKREAKSRSDRGRTEKIHEDRKPRDPLSVKTSSTENYSDNDGSEHKVEHRTKSRREAKSRSDRGRTERVPEERKATPEIPEPKKPPVGFFVPIFCDVNRKIPSNGTSNRQHKWFVDEKIENGLYDVKGPMKIQDCLKENNPDCYQSIKDRDEFIINRKIDRQIREESLLKEILASDIPYEDVEEYMSTYLKYCNPEQKKRALDYLEIYAKTKGSGDDRRIISSREMRERTARFLQYDFLEKQKKEALERKKQAIRHSQRNFSKNLRKYQQLGKVNVPDQLKLGRIK